MTRLFESLGIDYGHWKALTKSAILVEIRVVAARRGESRTRRGFGRRDADRPVRLLLVHGRRRVGGDLVHARSVPGEHHRHQLRDVHGRDGVTARSQRGHRLPRRSRHPRFPAGNLAHLLRRQAHERPDLHADDDDRLFVRADRHVFHPVRRRCRRRVVRRDLRRVGGDRADDGRRLRLAGPDRRCGPLEARPVVRPVPVELSGLRRLFRAVPRLPGRPRHPARVAEVPLAAAAAARMVRQLPRPRDRHLLEFRHRLRRRVGRGVRPVCCRRSAAGSRSNMRTGWRH